MQVGGELWRKETIYAIMDGKNKSIVERLELDPELKMWKCKQAGDECCGLTLLHAAVRFGNAAAASLLLQHGATDVCARDQDGKTPLDYAILNSEVGIVREMLVYVSSGNTPKMPNLAVALKKAETQLQSAERVGKKASEAGEVRDLLSQLVEEIERKRKADEEAAAAAEAEAARLLQEEIERAARAAAEAAAAEAAKEAEARRQQLEAEAQARLEEEARLRAEERRRQEAEEEAEEARRNERNARTQLLHFSSLVESSLLKQGIGKDAPIIAIRVRPLSEKETAADPRSMLCDSDGRGFEESERNGEGRLAPGPATNERFSLGDHKQGFRLFGCNTLQRDRDLTYGHADVQYNDSDQLNCYLEVGGTIIDSMTKGTNSTVIACGARDAGKSYLLSRPFHEHPFERDEYDESNRHWSAGRLVRSDDSGLVERVGRDLMSYRTVLQAKEPTAALFVVMSCFIIYQEKMYDLLAKNREQVLKSSQLLKVVGQEVKAGKEGRGVFVQGLTTCAIAPEGQKKRSTRQKSVRAWLMKADANRYNLAKDLKAGDKGLRRACCITMFEILQLSEVNPSAQAQEGRRHRRSGGDSSSKGVEKDKQILYSSCTFVDLPGAARVPSKDATKQKEDKAITKMQTCLSDCIEALAKLQKHKHAATSSNTKKGPKTVIPWRNSKLTMLLRDKIGGMNLTIMIGALSPASAELGSSRRTLEFLKICGSLVQPSIEDREANISVVNAADLEANNPLIDADEAAEKTAEKEKIREERKAKRARGEKVYDEETGEELLDDDDLDDDSGQTSFASLLNNPSAIVQTINDIGEASATSTDDAALHAHILQRKAELETSPENKMASIVGGAFHSSSRRKEQLELHSQLDDLRGQLKERVDAQWRLLAELKSLLQIYLDSEVRALDESSKSLSLRLTSILGGGGAIDQPTLGRSRSKFLSAFQDMDEKSSRAWTHAQLRLIAAKCEALVETNVEMGTCRNELRTLLQQQLRAINDQRLETFDMLQKQEDAAARRLGARAKIGSAAMGWHGLSLTMRSLSGMALNRQASAAQAEESAPESDDPIDAVPFECQLHDLGLLTMFVDSELSSLESPPWKELLQATLEHGRKFGHQLHQEIQTELSDAEEDIPSKQPFSRLRSMVSRITQSMYGLHDIVDKESLAQEVEFMSEFLAVDAFMDAESEMLHLAEGLAKAIHAILARVASKQAKALAFAAKLEQVDADETALDLVEVVDDSQPVVQGNLEQIAVEEDGVRTDAPNGRKLAAGKWHSVHVRPSDGAVLSWGGGHLLSYNGLAGSGTRNLQLLGQGLTNGPCVNLPGRVVGLESVKVREVAVGTMHTLLLSTDGCAWSCGVGKFGALGHGDKADQATPRPIDHLEEGKVHQVAAGAFHSLVVSSNGHLFAFGWGSHGRLGHGDAKIRLQPVCVASLMDTDISQVSAGELHSLAVDEEGTLYAWGCSSHGRLGLGETVTENQAVPAHVPLPPGVHIVQVSAGGTHSLVVATDQSVWSFGNGADGRLGHGDQLDCWIPTVIKSLQSIIVRQVEASMDHSMVVTADGKLLTFGYQEGWEGEAYDQHGEQLLPVVVQSLAQEVVHEVASSSQHTMILLASGNVYAYGNNEHCQLGNFPHADAREPILVEFR